MEKTCLYGIVVNGENGKQAEQRIHTNDLKKIAKAVKDKRQKNVPSKTIDEQREMYSRSGLGKAGMTETSMFFSPRNALALLELWNAINAVSNRKVKQKLRFAFTAILPRASKRYQWSPKRPLNAQNQIYYIAPVYYEWNVFKLFGRKINASISYGMRSKPVRRRLMLAQGIGEPRNAPNTCYLSCTSAGYAVAALPRSIASAMAAPQPVTRAKAFVTTRSPSSVTSWKERYWTRYRLISCALI